MYMDANLKVQGSWDNSDLYHTVINIAKACEEISPYCYTFAWGKICPKFFIHSEALKRTRLVRKWQRKTLNLADHIVIEAD
jgi:hypothetical protein